MHDIELEAIRTYENNLAFFAKSHPNLLKKLQAFDFAESNGDILSKYALEYKDGYFDVKDLQTQSYLYNTNSTTYAKKIAQGINYRKDSFLFTGLIDYKATKEQIEATLKQTHFTHSNIKDVLPIMNYAMEISPNTTTMKTIDKFICIGTGLGNHISTIHTKIHASEYFIIEDNLELFRLSMFVTSYASLAEDANLYFAVAQKDYDFSLAMSEFLEGSFFNNRYIKYFHFPAHSNQKIKLIQNNLAAQNYLSFPYDILLDKLLRPLKRIRLGYKTLDISDHFPRSEISDKPILVLAAGPSMKKNLGWVQKNHQKFIIIAVTAVLKTLHACNIKPDIITHIDGVESEGNSCMVHFEGFNAKEFLKDTICIFGTHTPDAVLELVDKHNVYFFENSTFYFNNFGSISTPCIGSTSVLLSLLLNTSETYLLGLDLALDQESGATHSGEHEYNTVHNLEESDQLNYTISLRNNLIPIKGNFRNIVYSTPLFISSVRSLYLNIPVLKRGDQYIFNLNDGAYLEQTIPINIDEIPSDKYDSFDKKQFSIHLSAIFQQRSRESLNNDEIASLTKRLHNAQEVIKNLIIYQQKKYTTENQYLYDLLGVVSSTLKFQGREGSNLTGVFSFYFQYVLPYIFDVVNTKEVTQKMKHLQKMDEMFIRGCFTIAYKYIGEVEKFFEK